MKAETKLGTLEIRKVNRARGNYPCPYHRNYKPCKTKAQLREHIARFHAHEVQYDADNLAEKDASNA